MLKIGITGGIGSGKTFISSIFNRLGIPVYYSDLQARLLMSTDPGLIESIKQLFGDRAYVNNELNRQYIAQQVFNRKTSLEKLNQIVHPIVEKDFGNWCSEQVNVPYVLKEAAILFESGSYKKLDKNIVIVSPVELRIKRVMERDNTTKNDIESRIKNQWPTEKLKALADFVIYNDNKQLLLPQVIEINLKIRE